MAPRKHCPARLGQSKAALDLIDLMDVPACLVLTRRSPQPLNLPPDVGHGPCEDCIPDRDPSLWSRIRARLRPNRRDAE